jgi:phosphopantothenoylcysteine decarboxylase/phosphopantothenate--cysteine ligase
VRIGDRPGRVLLCVSGGIAAYKAPELVRALVGQGLEVHVVMTEAAHAFVTEMSLATVSRAPVRTRILDTAEEGRVGHIELADWPDLVLVAPATADLLARAAAGLAGDLVTTCLLATRAPVLWAPAMNTNMWRHPATQANLATLAARGGTFCGPDRGELACGWIGEGRMIDPPIIVAEVLRMLSASGTDRDLAGRRVLVSAGPTRAYLDPVRFLTNASTGAMGFAIAEVAARRGADVVLVAGPVTRATPAGVRRIDVQTADQMLAAMESELQAAPVDLVAMVAAVADLAPATPRSSKLDKHELPAAMSPGAWVESVDVLATLAARHRGRAFFLGFGAQTVDDGADVSEALVAAGAAKLARKGCDAIFVNRVGAPGTGFESDTNAGVLLEAAEGGGSRVLASALEPVPKAALAGWILDRLRARLSEVRA